MNIQFNLLPSVKLEYVKANRNKRLVMLVAGSVISLALAVVISLFVVIQVFQKHYSSALSQDIQQQTRQLQDVTDINKILTVQNQLASLDTLHAKKPVTTRLLDFVQQVTPQTVDISSMNTDFTNNSITITGSADTIAAVNTFVDTLKFTTYDVGGTSNKAFSAVVLGSFTPSGSRTNYSLSFNFDPVIFDSQNDIKLTVPANKITTRSETEHPDTVFQGQDSSGGTQ